MSPLDGPPGTPKRSLVARSALLERLTSAASGVILASAPPGSGKTVVLREWIQSAGLLEHTAWVSVERDEHDAQRFWLAVVAALRGAIEADAFVEHEPTSAMSRSGSRDGQRRFGPSGTRRQRIDAAR